MNWGDLLAAVALYLIIEGLLPFLDPGRWRAALATLGQLTDSQLRWIGLASIGGGLLLLMVARPDQMAANLW